jgi:hypothetical protein
MDKPLPPRNPRRKKTPEERKAENAAKETLRTLTRRLPPKGLDAFMADITSDSDRSVAILTASFLERMLEEVILVHLTCDYRKTSDGKLLGKLVEPDGALNGFGRKIYLGYALDLYEASLVDEMEIVRKVRNVFAHSALDVSFETEAISNECKKTSCYKNSDGPAPIRDVYLKTCANVSKTLIEKAMARMAMLLEQYRKETSAKK